MIDKKPLLIAVVVCLAAGFLAGFYWPREKEIVFEPTGEGGMLGMSPPFDWTDPNYPTQSTSLGQEDIPEGAIEIAISAEGFVPAVFNIAKGEQVILTLTNQDKMVHLLMFEEEVLPNVHIETGPGQTKAITFYAPEQAGEYPFFCGVPGHDSLQEKGKMIVQ